MIPFENIHNRSSALRWPMMLSQITSIRKGGSSLGRVIFTDSPSCQLFHSERFSSGPSPVSLSGRLSTRPEIPSLSQDGVSCWSSASPRAPEPRRWPDETESRAWPFPEVRIREALAWVARQVASSLRNMAPSGMVRPRLRSTPLSPNSRPVCRRARSAFFGLCIRIDDRNHLAPSFALHNTCLAPTTIPLPVEARLLEGLPDGMGGNLRQPVGSLP